MGHPSMSAARPGGYCPRADGPVLASIPMGFRREDRAEAARQSWVVRLFYDTGGDLRGWRALGVVAALAAAVVLGTVMVSFAGAAFGPETLTIGALIVFLAIKYTVGLRVSEDEELAGLDISEHGMYGYPEQFIEVPGAFPEATRHSAGMASLSRPTTSG